MRVNGYDTQAGGDDQGDEVEVKDTPEPSVRTAEQHRTGKAFPNNITNYTTLAAPEVTHEAPEVAHEDQSNRDDPPPPPDVTVTTTGEGVHTTPSSKADISTTPPSHLLDHC